MLSCLELSFIDLKKNEEKTKFQKQVFRYVVFSLRSVRRHQRQSNEIYIQKTNWISQCKLQFWVMKRCLEKAIIMFTVIIIYLFSPAYRKN